jgi:hypothetical protein
MREKSGGQSYVSAKEKEMVKTRRKDRGGKKRKRKKEERSKLIQWPEQQQPGPAELSSRAHGTGGGEVCASPIWKRVIFVLKMEVKVA